MDNDEYIDIAIMKYYIDDNSSKKMIEIRSNEKMKFSNEFFEDEVRDGFFVPALIKQEWAVGLEILHEIDIVCEKHGIQYFADWGTLLATVRHQGYIPWDDDLDIAMKREDYNRFMEIGPKELPEGFEIHNFQTHEDHWLFLARVVNKGRICFEEEHLEKYHQFPYIVSVDIFVLDYVSADEEQEQKRDKDALFTIALADGISEGMYSLEVREEGLRRVEQFSGLKIDRNLEGDALRRRLYYIAQELFAKFSEDEAKELTQLFPFGLKNKNFRFPKEYYDNFIRLPYENTTIPVPLYYEKILHKRYRDFMKLIKCGGAHEYPYFQEQIDNLKRILDFEMPEYKFSPDQLRECQSGDDEAEKEVYSYKELAKECLAGMVQLSRQVIIELEHLNWDGAIQSLQEGQQLAIDLGTMIEAVKGEGHASIASLERYCESVYVISEHIIAHAEENAGRRLNEEEKQRIERQLETDIQNICQIFENYIFRRREIVFLPYKACAWNTMKSMWEEAVADPKTDVYVVPIPYFYKKYDGSFRAFPEEKLEYPAELNVLDYESFDLALHHPDMIVFQNPYDQWNPSTSVLPQFYSDKLQQMTDKLVYIPPYIMDDFTMNDERYYTNMKHYVTMPGVVRADEVVVQSEAMRNVYISKLTEFAGEDTKSIWERKIVVGKCETQKCSLTGQSEGDAPTKIQGRKKIAYYINASFLVEHRQDGLSKLKRVFQAFAENKEQIQVLFCAHNQLKAATEMVCPDLWNEYLEFVNQYIESDWLTIMDDMNWMNNVIAQANAYYGDGGYLALKIHEEGKPVMIQGVTI